VAAPKDGGKRLMDDLAKVGFAPEVSVASLPERVFVEMKRTAAGYAVHFLDYNPLVPVAGAALRVPEGAKAVFRSLDGGSVELCERGGKVELPAFTGYSLLEVFRGE
jgi:hypothetical protein